LLDNFIDDGDHVIDQSIHQQHLSWKDLPNQDEGLSELLARILDRSRPAVWQAPIVGSDEEADHTAATVDNILRLLGLHDYPLWRVHCRVSRRSLFVLARTHKSSVRS